MVIFEKEFQFYGKNSILNFCFRKKMASFLQFKNQHVDILNMDSRFRSRLVGRDLDCGRLEQESIHTKNHINYYFYPIYMYSLLVCLFVSNKRQNGWTDRCKHFLRQLTSPQGKSMDCQSWTIMPGKKVRQYLFLKICQFKYKNPPKFEN